MPPMSSGGSVYHEDSTMAVADSGVTLCRAGVLTDAGHQEVAAALLEQAMADISDGDSDIVMMTEAAAEAPQPVRKLKRSRIESEEAPWTIYVPKGRTTAVCATCLAPIAPRSVRVRAGAKNSRCHHVVCTDLSASSVTQCTGWNDLATTDQQQVKSCLSATGGQGPRAAEMAELPLRDASMTGASACNSIRDAPLELRNMEFWQSVSWSSLHDSVQTGPAVPPQVHHAVMGLRDAMAQYIGEASTSGNAGKEVLGWKALLYCDSLLFARPAKKRAGRRGQGNESLTKMIARRARSAWLGEWPSLWSESQKAIHVPGSGFPRTEAQMLAAHIAEIEAAMAEGDERLAIKRVEGPMRMASTQVALQQLPKLLPSAQQPLPAPQALAAEDSDVQQFLKVLDSCFAKAPKKRGHGPGSSRNEHWAFAPQFDELWQGLRRCFLNLALGKVPAEVLQAVASARVLAGAKGDSEVRPFALGSVIRRSISRATSQVFSSRLSAAVGEMQYGAGPPAGAEEMQKTVMTDLAMRPAACLSSFDVRNAHNEIERAAVINAVRQKLPELSPWVEPWLRTSTTHVCTLPGSTPMQLPKDRGGDQRDPLTNWLFPLMFAKVLERTREAARAVDSKARSYGYQDDANLVATVEGRTQGRQAFVNECSAVGLTMKTSKETVYFGPAAAAPATLECSRTARPVVLKCSGDIEVPVLIGDGASEHAPEAARLLDKRHVLVGRLRLLMRAGLSAQLALRLLRCRSNGDFTTLARTCGIHDTTAAALDRSIVEFLSQVTGSDGWSTTTERRIFHPFREGGLGFLSATMTVSAAFAASWHCLGAKVAQRLEFESVDVMRSQIARVDSWIEGVLSTTQRALRLDAPPPSLCADMTQMFIVKALIDDDVQDVSSTLELDPVAMPGSFALASPHTISQMNSLQRPSAPASACRWLAAVQGFASTSNLMVAHVVSDWTVVASML